VTTEHITATFDEPYSSTLATLSAYFPATAVGINGKAYLMDTASGRWTRESVDVVQQRNTTDPRDVLLLPQGVWRQQCSDWAHGAGQTNLDRENSLPSRFNTSYGINPWNRWQLSLLPSTTLLTDTDDKTGSMWLSTYGDYLAVINGETIDWWADPDDAAPYATDTVSAGNAIIGISSTGHVVTTLHANGKVWTTAGPAGTPTQWFTHTYPNASFIGWAKDYLLIGDANVLRDITTSSPETIYTHPDTGFRWQDACDGPNAIYTVGYLADHTVIHRIGIMDDATGLLPAVVAATLPDGEIGYTISSYLGYVFIGTNKGVRMAQPDSGGDLTLGALIPTDVPVYCFEGQDRFVWYGNGSIDGTYTNTPSDALNDLFPDAVVPGLGRMDLTTFTLTDLTPAYANDIVAASAPTGTVRSVVTWNGVRVFCVDAEGVFAESSTLMPAGWLQEGDLSFSVEDSKTALYQQLKVTRDSLGKVYVDLSYDDTGWVRSARFSNLSAGSVRSANLDGAQFSQVEARFVLERDTDDATAGPVLSRWEFRASPVTGRASRWTLPIILSEDVDIIDSDYVRDPVADYNELVALRETGELFTYQDSGQTHYVVARSYTWRPDKPASSGLGWTGVLDLVIEEVR
jgi:hypothetical protein